MNQVIAPEEMRRCEERNFAAGYADPIELMRIAGEGCAEEFLKFYSTLSGRKRLIIFAGAGNNGGDGVVAASVLAEKLPLKVILALTAAPEKLSSASRFYLDQLNKKVAVIPANELKLDRSDVVMDSLLGTGCRAPMREPYAALIKYINSAGIPVFAVDLPSGLGTDCCIKAGYTATIGYFKDILFTPQGVENTGFLRRIELPLTLLPESSGAVELQAMDRAVFEQTSRAVPRHIHKYQRGSVLICSGCSDYIQAPFLTACSALRAGAGLVRLGVPFAVTPGSGTLGVIPTQLPDEQGSLCAKSFDFIQPYLPKTDVIAAGPGMGRSKPAAEFIEKLLTLDKPLLLDADAIYLAAQFPERIRSRSALTVFTPHRGEAKFLAEAYKVELSGNDVSDALSLADAANAVVLLKAPRTVIAAPEKKVWINTSGTPALATAGSGDTLTGIIAAEMCKADPLIAAARGAFLHGLAGELAQQRFGITGVIADDLPEMAAVCACKLQQTGDIFA